MSKILIKMPVRPHRQKVLTEDGQEVRLQQFVGESAQLRKRFLLIITGKGSNSKPNIHGKTKTIKSEINNWLSDRFYNDKVQYISKALDRHGGEGAFYFFLKKSKNIFS